MKNAWKKLCSPRGETLVETMASILIFTMASIILLTMVSAATRIDTQAKKSDREIQEELVIAEKQADAVDIPETGAVTFTISTGTDIGTQSFNVNIYRKSEGALFSFEKATSAES